MQLNLFDYSPHVRKWVLLLLYTAELFASLWLAYELRFDFAVGPEYQQERLFVLLWLVPLQIVALALFHQLTPLLGYFSTPDLARMFHALMICTVIAMIIWVIGGAGYAPPRGVIAMNFVFALVGLTGVRHFCGPRGKWYVPRTPRRKISERGVWPSLARGTRARCWLMNYRSSRPGAGSDRFL